MICRSICIWFLIALAVSIAVVHVIRWPDCSLKNVQHQTTAITLQGTTGKALCFCQRRVKGRGGYLQAFTHHTAIHAAVWVAHKLTITAAILSTAAPTTGSNCTQNDWKTSRHLEGHTQFKTTSKIHLSKQSGVTHLFVCLAQIASQWDSPLHFIYFPALQLSMDFFFF